VVTVQKLSLWVAWLVASNLGACRPAEEPQARLPSCARGGKARPATGPGSPRCECFEGYLLQPDGSCAEQPTVCSPAGGSGSAKTFHSCCKGLAGISAAQLVDGECTHPGPDAIVCASCGDGVCGGGENVCNCKQDCPAASDATTEPKAASAPAPPVPTCSKEPRHERFHPPRGLPVVNGPVNLDVAAWKEQRLEEMSWREPPGVFSTKKVPGGVDLWSEVMVDAPHGVPAGVGETRHWFKAEIRLRNETFAEAVCSSIPHYFTLVFDRSPVPSSAAEPLTVAGRKAFVIHSGLHGYFSAHYIVPLSASRAATVAFDYIGGGILEEEFKKRHRAFVAQQEPIMNKMIDSIRFATP
jgi:hypothetical protein